MKRYRILFFTIMLLPTIAISSFGQNKAPAYVKYIEQYNDLAVSHMKKYKIPASITLAQGLLESGAGMSQFVKDSNNHFGIKCASEWTGQKIYRDDNLANECFRKYSSPEDSFDDHSRFLAEKNRYAALFSLDISDYRAWAKGLQQCGYATDKAYANKLIKLIEDYELYHYDSGVKKSKSQYATPQSNRDVYKTFGLIYVLAESNDDLETIASELGFKTKNLAKYNDIPADFPLRKGDIIYLEKKKKKADIPYFQHTVRVGESMHSISQQYGIQLSQLYKLNKKASEYIPEEGDLLRLR
ncbi:MAG: glucosaminidase domain-containing protein [Dysgonamonadaceae bacterium]|nr:glucosaminidase domain-containing protein [Dysgonamonadaceae bacterium]